MQFSKLRVTGFKSFVEATDFLFEPGLTGIVGPNGCGKSNLVEAMRWVMGESSYKNMRASGMDDVIFSGSGNRPSRNIAEVSLVLDNSGRTAPAAFNAHDIIEVTRKIERESGSAYRINGQEARARDVQLLFADASTGARSPAMVRQGQIGEIIAARPQARRRILEEAAGVSGLYSRRHEAELRLKGAEENIVRLEDVLRQIDAQADSLRRQARQAGRYRILAADIRRLEALQVLVAYRDAEARRLEAKQKQSASLLVVAERTQEQAATARLQALAAADLPRLRDAEARAGAALQRLVLARESLDGEEARIRERAAELIRTITQLTQDHAREATLRDDAQAMLARLDEEETGLNSGQGGSGQGTQDAQADAQRSLEGASQQLALSEKELASVQSALAENEARRASLAASLREAESRLVRLETALAQSTAERIALEGEDAGEEKLLALGLRLEEAIAGAKAAEDRATGLESALGLAREAAQRSQSLLAEAERAAQKLETEARTLEKMLSSGPGRKWSPVADHILVKKGYEAALGAALGDDLEASTEAQAPVRWNENTAQAGDPSLPGGVDPLSNFVSAPPALARRLAHIGLVGQAEGAHLARQLVPGQRLVSMQGDLWRWDGLSAAANAPTPAARRLAEKNRLGDIVVAFEEARQIVLGRRREADGAQEAVRLAMEQESAARQAHRMILRQVDDIREQRIQLERALAKKTARLAALKEAETRLGADRQEASAQYEAARGNLADIRPAEDLIAQRSHLQAKVAQDRTRAAEARALALSLAREVEALARRLAVLAADRISWRERHARSLRQIGELEARLAEAHTNAAQIAEAPEHFQRQRRALINEIDVAEENRKTAADARTQAETAQAQADMAARRALEGMGQARELLARHQAEVEAMESRQAEMLHAIATEMDCDLAGLSVLAGVEPNASLPPAQEISGKLEALRADRERLGPVNLRAETELAEIEQSRHGLITEKSDLTEAIKRLRSAIQTLNKEGRERLLAAFEQVNGHFTDLFTTLFGGGTAELSLIESDDPLEAGLEIFARPPGKKPQTMTLLSGGEQALTAMALIFAVFLTNPSPICVLDEVDAPLDDANVERFCDLLDEMTRRTSTRFIAITHNPITMSRMDRLYGVTMAERGVSQLVSVDLAGAERFLEAG